MARQFMVHHPMTMRLFIQPCQFVRFVPKIIRPHPQPSRPPDMAPCDFLLSPKLKLLLKGRCFDKNKIIEGIARYFKRSFDWKGGNSNGKSMGIAEENAFKRPIIFKLNNEN